MTDNNQSIRATIKTVEHMTIVTIETVERITIEIVSTTADTVSDLVRLIADSLPPPQKYGAQRYHIDYDADSVDADLVNEIQIYLDDSEHGWDEDAILMHATDAEDVVIENSATDGEPGSDTIETAWADTKPVADGGAAEAESTELARKEVNIAFRKSVLQASKNHAEESMRHEVGGIMLGELHITKKGERLTLITGIVRANKAKQMPASLNITLEAWADVWRLIDGDDEYGVDGTALKMVGWYHTHPNFGIFFSGADHTVHDPHFTHPCHVALVIDPRRKEYGFFAKAREHSPAERCNEDENCDVLDDDELVAWWKRHAGRTITLPKVEIPSDGDGS